MRGANFDSYYIQDVEDPGDYEEIAIRRPQAKHEYKCYVCEDKIEKGQRYILNVGKFEGKFIVDLGHLGGGLPDVRRGAWAVCVSRSPLGRWFNLGSRGYSSPPGRKILAVSDRPFSGVNIDSTSAPGTVMVRIRHSW